jgi:hypothetical protein
MLSELGVRHDARRKGHEPQAELKTIRFLLAVVRDEQLRAFGASVSSRDRRAGKSGATGELRMIEAPTGKGRASAALQKLKAILTSVSQLTANSRQLCS